MLPNLSIPSLTLFGPIQIHPFGVLVALALVVGYHLALARARKTGLDLKVFADAGISAIAIGFVVSHLFWAILYNYPLVSKNPLILVMIWKGISSYGGFFGGTFGGWIYLRRKKVPALPYLEAMLFGFVPAWAIARTGCTIAFDHPGRTTSFFLGMADGAGVVRHNLGLYEMLWTVAIAAVLYALKGYRPFKAFHISLVFLLYAPVRFYFDSLRVGDRTYLGYTPGQYFSVVVLVIGVWLLVRGIREA
jgi:phosphatidylglycerol:prolipoprotein diacylglycerol transferase